jgi:small nuclear ribonucleoprotein (snRNP)-like protein
MNEFNSLSIEEPIDLVKLCINKYVRVKLRHDLELKGKLHVRIHFFK